MQLSKFQNVFITPQGNLEPTGSHFPFCLSPAPGRHSFPCCVCPTTHCVTAGKLITHEDFFPRYKNIKICLLNTFQSNGSELLIQKYTQIISLNTRENPNSKENLKIHTSQIFLSFICLFKKLKQFL